MKEQKRISSAVAKQMSELADMGNEYAKDEEAVTESRVEESIRTAHMLSTCIHKEENYHDADDDEIVMRCTKEE